MKHVRFLDPAGSIRHGTWVNGQVNFGGREYSAESINFLPPSDPTKIIGVGLNYHHHADELGMAIPDQPSLFLVGPNSLSGHNSTVRPPARDANIEHEAELGVIIGEQCRNIPVNDAMDVVKGFTCVNDISNRTEQFREQQQDLFRGKAFDNSMPIGPVLAEPEDVPKDATIRLRVNGSDRQTSSRMDMIYNVPQLVAHISNYLTLESGDIISTGTPAGVGQLEAGDQVEIEVDGVGTLKHYVQFP